MLMLSQSFPYKAFLLSTAPPDSAQIHSEIYDIYLDLSLSWASYLMLTFSEEFIVLTFSFPFLILLFQAIISRFEKVYSVFH